MRNSAPIALALLCACGNPSWAGMGATGEELIAVGVESLVPMGLHYGVWRDVEWCTGITLDISTIQWFVADKIIAKNGWLAYGATIFDSTGVPVGIIVDRRYWLHPGVLSHEICHALTRNMAEDSDAMLRCQMRLPGDLPWRPFPPDSVAKYEALAGN